jgi:hypothetical protein
MMIPGKPDSRVAAVTLTKNAAKEIVLRDETGALKRVHRDCRFAPDVSRMVQTFGGHCS